jgi:hypothetical protein
VLSDGPGVTVGAGTHTNEEKFMKKVLIAALPLILCLPGFATAEPTKKCKDDILKGQYVFTASGFTRPPASGPGIPWVPKAILEVLHFNGDGTLTTPAVTVANPFGDSGNILQPGAGADGTYSINEDCTGTVQFSDAANVTFKIYVDPPRQHDLDDPDQPNQQRVPGQRHARVLMLV